MTNPTPPSGNHEFLLGKISGQIENVSQHLSRQDAKLNALEGQLTQRMDKLDDRLRTVEQKAAAAGAISGTAVSVGMALIIEGLKHWIAGGAR